MGKIRSRSKRLKFLLTSDGSGRSCFHLKIFYDLRAYFIIKYINLVFPIVAFMSYIPVLVLSLPQVRKPMTVQNALVKTRNEKLTATAGQLKAEKTAREKTHVCKLMFSATWGHGKELRSGNPGNAVREAEKPENDEGVDKRIRNHCCAQVFHSRPIFCATSVPLSLWCSIGIG